MNGSAVTAITAVAEPLLQSRLVLVLGMAGVALGIVALVGSFVVGTARNPTGVARSLAAVEALRAAPKSLREQELEIPFRERVLGTTMRKITGLGRRLTPADQVGRIRKKLDLAGNPPGWTVDRVMSGKVVGAMGGFGAGLLFSFMLDSTMTKILVVIGVTVAGFFAPAMYLYQRAYDRSARIQRELPDAIDLLTISVESGLGFDAALLPLAGPAE